MPRDNEDVGENHGPPLPVVVTRLITKLADVVKQSANASSIPEAARPVLLALHLIYPHLLLDALDLLDRQCVTKLNVTQHRHHIDQGESEAHERCLHPRVARQGDNDTPSVLTQQRHDIVAEMAAVDAMEVSTLDNDEEDEAQHDSSSRQDPVQQTEPPLNQQTTPAYSAFCVRSARPPPPRFSSSPVDDSGTASFGYTVHLIAWNCSCPAFAVMAFGGGPQASEEAGARLGSVLANDGTGRERSSRVVGAASLPDELCFGFGGLDAFAYEEGNEEGPAPTLHIKKGQHALLPPCCKHLLACVLAVTMPNVFGAYDQHDTAMTEGQKTASKGIVERWVDAEEAAGWAAGFGFET